MSTSKSVFLKSCPFCGVVPSQPEQVKFGSPKYWLIECTSCLIIMRKRAKTESS